MSEGGKRVGGMEKGLSYKLETAYSKMHAIFIS